MNSLPCIVSSYPTYRNPKKIEQSFFTIIFMGFDQLPSFPMVEKMAHPISLMGHRWGHWTCHCPRLRAAGPSAVGWFPGSEWMLTTFFGLQMGMHPLVNPLKMVIYQLKMVIFHSYVSLPEGNRTQNYSNSLVGHLRLTLFGVLYICG